MKPYSYEQPVIRQCPDCKRLFTHKHPDCPDDHERHTDPYYNDDPDNEF